MSKRNRELSPFFVLLFLILGFCLVLAFDTYASIAHKKEVIIAETAYCEILAISSNVPKQATRYTKQLLKLNDTYHDHIVFYSIKALGFIDGAIYQQDIRNPTAQQYKRVSTDLFIKKCGISF